MEKNSSLTAVHTLGCMLCTQSFTVNWVGTELVQKCLTKFILFCSTKCSHLEVITCPDVIPSQWTSFPAWCHESLVTRKLTQGRYQNASQHPTCLTAMTRPNHRVSPLSSTPDGAVASCTGKRQHTTKSKKSGRLSHFPRVMESTKQQIIHLKPISWPWTLLCSFHSTQLKEFDTKGQHIIFRAVRQRPKVAVNSLAGFTS